MQRKTTNQQHEESSEAVSPNKAKRAKASKAGSALKERKQPRSSAKCLNANHGHSSRVDTKTSGIDESKRNRTATARSRSGSGSSLKPSISHQSDTERSSNGKQAGTKRIGKPVRTTKDTKRDRLITVLSKPSGATGRTIAKLLGWQPHTVRAAICGLRKSGLSITASRSLAKAGNKPQTIYRIASGKSGDVADGKKVQV